MRKIKNILKDKWNFLKRNVNQLLITSSLVALLFTGYQIKLNRDDFALRWRPELFATQDSFGSIADSIVVTNTWKNAGGSPALEINRYHLITKDKEPRANGIKQPLTTHFLVWPGDNKLESNKYKMPFFGFDKPTYLHIIAWYKDRRRQEYWVEYVYFFYVLSKDSSAVVGIDGVYEGKARGLKGLFGL